MPDSFALEKKGFPIIQHIFHSLPKRKRFLSFTALFNLVYKFLNSSENYFYYGFEERVEKNSKFSGTKI